ncbi:MAG: alpha/beta fold hydrolase [Porticoccaceae bacterium]
MTYLPTIDMPAADQPASAAVIWLHGLGASGDDFVPIVPELRLPADAAIRFVFPQAPTIPVTVNGGYRMPAWYDILDMNIERKLDRAQLLASAQKIHDLIDREIARGIASERILLAGFSQGGAVAYEAALTYPKPLAGLLALSTYFATADTVAPHAANRQLPIHIFHGSGDPVVPEILGRRAVESLTALGYAPGYSSYPMGHEVCIEEIADIGARLRDWLAL